MCVYIYLCSLNLGKITAKNYFFTYTLNLAENSNKYMIHIAAC